MKPIAIGVIIVVCILVTSGITYAAVNAYKDQEIADLKIQYESDISSLNSQISNLDTQVTSLNNQLEDIDNQLEDIDYENLSKLERFKGHWWLQNVTGNTSDDHVFKDFSVRNTYRYRKCCFNPSPIENRSTGFLTAHPDNPIILLYKDYYDINPWVFTYEFLTDDTVVLTYDSINATYTRT